MTELDQSPRTSSTHDVLREQRTELRGDLQVTRQVAKNQPLYVVYDPVSYQAHRLSLTDYRVVSCLSEHRSLQGCFERAVSQGLLDVENEKEFYQFIAKLDALGLLTTSNQDPDQLFQRFKAKAAAARKGKVLGFLFLTLPLANPDRFLDRSLRRVSFLFSKQFFVLWCVALVAALSIIVVQWRAFLAPINSILAVNNLLFMSLAFLGLKIWHELGHGYACKRFGGRVPEMGCKLIVGMPLAYVDASSAWSFPRRMNRIIVMLGGMYFESLVAILATFIWAWSPNSFVGSCAYQLIFMAGVATLFFNANPLMRFDGYFILSDAIGMPNLRSRSIKEVQNCAKRIVLNLNVSLASDPFERIVLRSYGIASSIYMVSLTISIAALIATRFHAIGLALAAFQLGSMAWRTVSKLFTFLLSSPETSEIRGRSRAVAGGLAVGVPLLLLILPVPIGVRFEGLVDATQSTVVRAKSSGIVVSLPAEMGMAVSSQTPLVRLANLDLATTARVEEITAYATARHALFVATRDTSEGAKQRLQAVHQAERARQATQTSSELIIRAPHPGVIADVIPKYQIGSFIAKGDPLATVADGQTTVRCWLDEEQLATAKVELGADLVVRIADGGGRSHHGKVISIAPASAAEFDDLALSTLGDGVIAVDPETGETNRPMFQVRVLLPELTSDNSLQDVRAFVRAGRRYESIGSWVVRSTRQFVNKLFSI